MGWLQAPLELLGMGREWIGTLPAVSFYAVMGQQAFPGVAAAPAPDDGASLCPVAAVGRTYALAPPTLFFTSVRHFHSR